MISNDIFKELKINYTNYNSSLENVNNSVSTIKNSILDNWIQQDENRAYALKMFDKFEENIKDILKCINDISKSISISIDSYNKSVSKVNAIPSLASMFEEETTTQKEYTVEQQQVLTSIEKNFDDNKSLNDRFNDTLVSEVKSDLKNKGIIE